MELSPPLPEEVVDVIKPMHPLAGRRSVKYINNDE
jgi:hypothetical protein